MPSLEFFVPGLPVQQGSKNYGVRRNGTAFGYESAKGLPKWRKAVQEAAEAACLASDEWESGYDGPVSMGPVVFVFNPISSGRYWKTSAPDLSKLVRAIEDAMTTAKVYRDDARIVRYGEIFKIHGVTAGVTIRVSTVPTHPFEGAIAA